LTGLELKNRVRISRIRWKSIYSGEMEWIQNFQIFFLNFPTLGLAMIDLLMIGPRFRQMIGSMMIVLQGRLVIAPRIGIHNHMNHNNFLIHRFESNSRSPNHLFLYFFRLANPNRELRYKSHSSTYNQSNSRLGESFLVVNHRRWMIQNFLFGQKNVKNKNENIIFFSF